MILIASREVFSLALILPQPSTRTAILTRTVRLPFVIRLIGRRDAGSRRRCRARWQAVISRSAPSARAPSFDCSAWWSCGWSSCPVDSSAESTATTAGTRPWSGREYKSVQRLIAVLILLLKEQQTMKRRRRTRRKVSGSSWQEIRSRSFSLSTDHHPSPAALVAWTSILRKAQERRVDVVVIKATPEEVEEQESNERGRTTGATVTRNRDKHNKGNNYGRDEDGRSWVS